MLHKKKELPNDSGGQQVIILPRKNKMAAAKKPFCVFVGGGALVFGFNRGYVSVFTQ